MHEQVNAKRESILQAALKLIITSGVEQVSTAAVHRTAQVSRTTLYRYFPTRQSLIEGVITHISDMVERRLKVLILEHPEPHKRIDLIISLATELFSQRVGERLLQADPGFVMQVLNRTLQRNIDIMNAAMADYYRDVEALTGERVNAELVGNVIQRVVITLTLLPNPPLPGDLADTLRAIYRALLFDIRISRLGREGHGEAAEAFAGRPGRPDASA